MAVRRTLTLTVLMLLAFCVWECAAQNSKPYVWAVSPIVVGVNKDVKCSFTSTPAPANVDALTFVIEGGQILNNPTVQTVSSSLRTYTLVFNILISAGDNGKVFTCTGWNGQESSYTMYVTTPPTTPVISGPTFVMGGSTNSWSCVVDGASSHPPQVTWRYNAATVTGAENDDTSYQDSNNINILKRNSTLAMFTPTGTADFNLECEAYHLPTSTTISSEITVTVRYPPVIAGNNVTYTVTAGNSFTIPCEITASPSATSMAWYKDDVLLVTTEGSYSGGTLNSPDLVINPVNDVHKGVYRCEAGNTYGTTQSNFSSLIVQYIPIVTYSANPASGTAGSTITVDCIIDAYPAVTTVRWYTYDSFTSTETQITPTTGSSKYSGGTVDIPGLTISNLQPSDADVKYRCKAINDVETGTGGLLTLQIVYLFVSTSNATSVAGNLTESLTIPCSYQAYPSVFDVQWTKNGEPIDVSSPAGKYVGSTLANPSLTIHSLTQQDAGIYVCKATNNDTTESSQDITVTVNYAPVFENSTQVNLVERKGNTTTLECQASAKPPPTAVLWYKSDSLLNVTGRYSGGTVTDPNLTITELDSSDTATYSCHVTNSVGTGVSAEINLDVQYPPEILSDLTPVTRTESSLINMPCNYDANPFPTDVIWTKNGVPLNFTSGAYAGGTPGTPGLTIISVVPNDTGTYVCTVVNPLGQASGAIPVTVIYKPKITPEDSTDVLGDEGQSVTLLCAVMANPAVTSVQWEYNGSVMDLRDSVKYQGGTADSPSLTVQDLQTSDTGIYRCQVTNAIGTSYGGSLNLTVNFKPEITVQTSASGTEPQDVTLQCQVTAVPAPSTLVWYKDNAPFNTSDATRYSGGTTSTPSLTILGVGAEDVGSYYCVATNSQGSTTSDTITLTVEYIPVITVASMQVGGTLSDTLTISVTVQANPALTSVNWLKESNSGTLILNTQSGRYSGGTVSNPSLVIQNLNVADVGNYKVRVVNSMGTRESGYIEVAVSYAPTNPGITGLANSYNEYDPISLTCAAAGFPEPEYRWFRGSASVGVGPTLVIAQASPADYAQFKCEAYNEQGSSSSTVAVNVLYKPRAASTIQNVTASFGQTVTLTCATDSNPSPTGYRWYRENLLLTTATEQLTMVVTNSTMLGRYYCVATNSQGDSDDILVFVSEDGDNGGTGQSTEDTGGLSVATIILIVIICLIVLVILVLILIYCCTTRKCFKKDNDVGPQHPETAVTVAPHPMKPVERFANGYIPPPRDNFNNDRIKLDDEKADEKATNGITPINHGLIISVPDAHTPRPHLLPPLGEDGVAKETESAREEKKKKKKKRRRHREENGGDSPHHHRHRHHHSEVDGNDDVMV